MLLLSQDKKRKIDSILHPRDREADTTGGSTPAFLPQELHTCLSTKQYKRSDLKLLAPTLDPGHHQAATMSDSASPPFNYGGDETDPEVVGPRPKRIRHKPMSAAQQKAALSSLRAKLAEPAPKPPAISDTASKAQAPVSADVKQKNPELDAETTSPDEAAQSDDDAAKSGDEVRYSASQTIFYP